MKLVFLTCCWTLHQSKDDPRVTLSHHRLECPARAVCGDQWDTIRDWYNGTRCADRRVLLHCLCPGNRQCPVGNEDHMLHISKKHKQYLCEETCDVGTCGSFRRNAMQLVQFSPDFARKNYYKINCRCPGHSNPIRRRGLNRAVSFTGQYEADYRTGIRYVNYRCNRVLSLYANASNPADTGPQDPCRTS